MKINILILGKGGREHALARKCRTSQLCNDIFVIPGNYGISDCANVYEDFDYLDNEKILTFAKTQNIGLTIVGDELFLSNGVVDLFEKNNLKIFGPTMKASKIESSKIFAKNLFKKYNIPTADYFATRKKEDALDYIKSLNIYPIVIKNDGLASGKGVFIVKTQSEGEEIIKDIFDKNIFNNKKCGVVIEEFLDGREFSLLALVNEDVYVSLQPAKDYKKIFDNDLGDNTGGMGCYTPVEYINQKILSISNKNIISKTIKALKNEGIIYKGVLYAGLILTRNNEIKVIEFNSRFGDPETEVLMPAMKNDIIEVILKILNKEEPTLEWHKKYFIGVTIASKGYPKNFEKGVPFTNKLIYNIENVYHMGTKYNHEKKEFQSNGGRLVFILESHENKKTCIDNLYKSIDKLDFRSFYYRRDIGK
ncbi:phosphoribosylamine--glycine ligase [Spiroplasma corruscae]|uniref:Phosphoribosylamine--glycine ligase n=1 Tax=Spiroplasma corruscae TaxID=216934 RepID=A0A222EQB7_9MOLU|nr:phosphoribosylamine--glycine ligase [Spiroplasma corruscae]ASP28672.1 phosphoribosylamine--glycine ligase [Spiroplasma corruscae]